MSAFIEKEDTRTNIERVNDNLIDLGIIIPDEKVKWTDSEMSNLWIWMLEDIPFFTPCIKTTNLIQLTRRRPAGIRTVADKLLVGYNGDWRVTDDVKNRCLRKTPLTATELTRFRTLVLDRLFVNTGQDDNKRNSDEDPFNTIGRAVNLCMFQSRHEVYDLMSLLSPKVRMYLNQNEYRNRSRSKPKTNDGEIIRRYAEQRQKKNTTRDLPKNLALLFTSKKETDRRMLDITNQWIKDRSEDPSQQYVSNMNHDHLIVK